MWARAHLPDPGSFAGRHSPAQDGAVAAPPKRRRRGPLVWAAAASLAANVAFVSHARSDVLRPSFDARSATAPTAARDVRGAGRHPAVQNAFVAPSTSPNGMSTRGKREPAHTRSRARRLTVRAAGGQPRQERPPTASARAHAPRRPRHATLHRSHSGSAGSGVTLGGGTAVVHWSPVPSATYYDLVLWRDGKRVLDLWPETATATLSATRTLDGARKGLRPGRYLWFAYPGLGSRATRRYGEMAASGSVVIHQPRRNR